MDRSTLLAGYTGRVTDFLTGLKPVGPKELLADPETPLALLVGLAGTRTGFPGEGSSPRDSLAGSPGPCSGPIASGEAGASVTALALPDGGITWGPETPAVLL